MRNRTSTVLSLALCSLTASAFALTRSNDNRFEIQSPKSESSVSVAGMSINPSHGAVRALYHVRDIDQPALNPKSTLEQRARDYLIKNAELFGFTAEMIDQNLAYHSTVQTSGGSHVRFHQHYDGVEVYRSDIVVNIDLKGAVHFVANSQPPSAAKMTPASKLTSAEAESITRKHFELSEGQGALKSTPMIYLLKDALHAVYRIQLSAPERNLWDWEIIVDAATGVIHEAADRALTANARGKAFDPSPVVRLGSKYGDNGLVDANNANSDALTSQTSEVDLLDVQQSGGKFNLNGKYASITDSESPKTGLYGQVSDTFNCLRADGCFEAVNTYYHIDRSMRYINETLGISLKPRQYSGGVRFDPHGLSGADNSHFSSSSGELAFGDGGVDDAEDLDVVIHELGHGIHDWITQGHLSQVDGLSEGCGDYWAASYNRGTSFSHPTDPSYHWVFSWDGHNPYWPGRVTNTSKKYPAGLNGEVHADGELWASTLMSIWNDLGKEITDRLFLEGLAMTGSSSNQEEAAAAMIKADATLYQGAHIDVLKRHFSERGYRIAL